MKLTSIVGTGTGRLGGSVFAVRNGQQIVRAYQAVVQNPKSIAQVSQRAKMKLASQISAVFAKEITPWRREGSVSGRNRFVSSLFSRGSIMYDDAESRAEINLLDIDLTGSRVPNGMGRVGDVSVEGFNVTIPYFIFDEFRGGMAVVIIVRPSTSVGAVILGKSETVIPSAGNVTTITTTSTQLQTGDIIFYYSYKVVEADLPTIYKDIQGELPSTDFVEVVKREAPSAIEYSISHSERYTV